MSDLNDLRKYLRQYEKDGIALAFSGGVDSSFLLAILNEERKRNTFPLCLFFAQSIFQKQEEAELVQSEAEKSGVPLKILTFDPLSIPAVKQNLPMRCYHCKKQIFDLIAQEASNAGLHTVMDGTNGDDLQSYRPGLAALKESGIISPLAELKIGKQQIRQWSAEMGLSCADKPSVPCLATRFPYHTELNEAIIRQAAAGEDFLHQLMPEVSDLRLRVHGTLARIEVPAGDMGIVLACREAIVNGLKAIGYEFVSLDLSGFRSGSFDRLARLGDWAG